MYELKTKDVDEAIEEVIRHIDDLNEDARKIRNYLERNYPNNKADTVYEWATNALEEMDIRLGMLSGIEFNAEDKMTYLENQLEEAREQLLVARKGLGTSQEINSYPQKVVDAIDGIEKFFEKHPKVIE